MVKCTTKESNQFWKDQTQVLNEKKVCRIVCKNVECLLVRNELSKHIKPVVHLIISIDSFEYAPPDIKETLNELTPLKKPSHFNAL